MTHTEQQARVDAAVVLDDYDPESGALKVLGKGRKQRLVYATHGAAAALEAWIDVRGSAPGPRPPSARPRCWCTCPSSSAPPRLERKAGADREVWAG